MPLLSVVVPVYNTSEMLEACLDSLLAQKFRDFELILVNDGSTDCSPEICRRYRDREPDRITFLTGPNGGVAAAYNRGLDAAQGEWVTFCDSDDRVEPDLYDELYRRAVETGADLSSCALREISPAGERIRKNFPFDEIVIQGEDEVRERCFLPLLFSRPGHHGFLPICLFRRSVIEAGKVRFFPGLSLLEDEMFLLEFLMHARSVATLDAPLYVYVRGDASLCAKYFSPEHELELEKMWIVLETKRLKTFMASGMAPSHPELAAEFRTRIFYHEAQAVCRDPAYRGRVRREKLREIADAAERDLGRQAAWSRALPVSVRAFLAALFYFRPGLPLLCALKRRKDRRERSRNAD